MKEKAQNLACVILAAGKGTRMRSTLPKVMHAVAGKPMLMNVIDTVLACNAEHVIVVTSPEMESVREQVQNQYHDKVHNAVQHKQLGTGDAVKAAEKALAKFKGTVVVLYGDTPLIEQETIQSIHETLQSSAKNAVTVLGIDIPVPNAYGRLITDKKGNVESIVEVKDATEKQKQITLSNSGMMAIRGDLLFGFLSRLDNKNANGEYYLTDVVKLAHKDGYSCSLVLADPKELMGVNSRPELAVAERIAQDKLRQKVMESGVTLIDPSTVYLRHDTQFGKDVIVHPNVVFGTKVKVEDNVEIRSFCHIEDAVIRKNATVGPFARIRPGSDVGESAHIGNFVELKKAKVEKGAKVNHLSYIGDAHVGEKTNIGAGTITCNYDGFSKYKTEIGAGAFIGSNTALVAPVKVGDGAIIAAGSVITQDVPADALAIARSRQEGKKDWAKKFKDKKTD